MPAAATHGEKRDTITLLANSETIKALSLPAAIQ
jgi:hypothetical protein